MRTLVGDTIKKGIIYGILGALTFSLITPIGKLALVDLDASIILSLRFIIAIILLLLIGYIKKEKIILSRKDIIPLTILGSIFTLDTYTYWLALEQLDIVSFLSIFWTFPLFILLIDILYGKVEQIYRSLFIILVGFIGVILTLI